MSKRSSNNCIKVNLISETHDIYFEQPVHSVEFSDGSSVPLNRKAIRTRNILGSLLFIAVITNFYFANENMRLKGKLITATDVVNKIKAARPR